jgi:hypothetical protein
MLFTVYHCHNQACGHRVWVSINQLGARGKCPGCGNIMTIPADLPREQFFEGPDFLESVEESWEDVPALQI